MIEKPYEMIDFVKGVTSPQEAFREWVKKNTDISQRQLLSDEDTSRSAERLTLHDDRQFRQTPDDVYSIITDRIIDGLENGYRPWDKPWQSGVPTRPLRHNGERYQGINVVMLWLTASERGYTAPYWMTFQQAVELGGHVRKGEKGTLHR